MPVRVVKQKQEEDEDKNLTNEDEEISASPDLIESTLFLMPEQSQAQASSFEQQQSQQQQQLFNASTTMNDYEHPVTISRRTTVYRVPVPVHNASQWFNGPDMQNERSSRMEKVVSSLVRRPFRPISDNGYLKFN